MAGADPTKNTEVDDESDDEENDDETDDDASMFKVKNQKEEKMLAMLASELQNFRKLPILKMSSKQRKFLFFWHALIFILAFFIMFKGMTLERQFDEVVSETVQRNADIASYNYFLQITSYPEMKYIYGRIVGEYGNALVLLGFIYLFSTVGYISFLTHRFAFTLPAWIFVTIIGLIIQLSNLLVRLSPEAHISSDAQKTVTEKLHYYQVKSLDDFSKALDFLSIWGECCGIYSMYDFQSLTVDYTLFRNGETTKLSFQAPPVCCKDSVFRAGTQAVIDCAKTLENTWSKGCFFVFFQELQDLKYESLAVWILLTLDIAIHIYIYRDMINRFEPQLGLEMLDDMERKRRYVMKIFEQV